MKILLRGFIAPAAEGYFVLDFDFSSVDVSFDYEIAISINEQSAVADLIATGYIIDDSPNAPVPLTLDETDSKFHITDHFNYESSNTIISYKILVKWDDSEDATMDNSVDTLATLDEDDFASLDVMVSFTQTI